MTNASLTYLHLIGSAGVGDNNQNALTQNSFRSATADASVLRSAAYIKCKLVASRDTAPVWYTRVAQKSENTRRFLYS